MRLTVIGCGDAFGAGGRLQTCFYVQAKTTSFLIDCGASTLIGFNRERLDPNTVDTVFLSHLHGDHFAGLVWWMIHAMHVAKRKTPLTIVGPVGTESRVETACETLFPGSTKAKRRFDLHFVEYGKETPIEVNGTRLTAYEVEHPSGAMSSALRLEHDGEILSYSGDTQWVDTLLPCADGADLFISECYGYMDKTPYHLSWRVLSERLDALRAKRILITHMNQSMLDAVPNISHPKVVFAEDGLVLPVAQDIHGAHPKWRNVWTRLFPKSQSVASVAAVK